MGWVGGGAGEVQKKIYSRKGKLNKKPSPTKHPPPPITFLMVRP